MDEWITIQLSERGEDTLNEDPSIIERALKKITKSEYFIPVYFNKSKSYDNKIFLFTGYVFVKYNKNDFANYLKFTNNIYFEGPLLVSKKLHLTPDYEIERLKKELERLTTPTIKKGDRVKVIDGKYKNLDAEVTSFDDENREADLKVKLKCMHIIVPAVPSACLVKIEDEDVIIEQTNESINLQKIILNLLEENISGLTKKQIFINLNLTEKETKKASETLNDFLSKEIILFKKDKNGKQIFFLRDNTRKF
jgi:transcription antitermination factor NusG